MSMCSPQNNLKWNSCLYKLILQKSHQYITRNDNDIATYQCRTDAFKFSFFPWAITEWNKVDIKI